MSALPMPWVYVWYAVSFGLLTTWLSGRELARRLGDYSGFMLYFLAFFMLLLVGPVLGTVLAGDSPATALAAWGLSFGRSRLGLLLLLAYVPILAVLLLVAARDRALSAMYPLARSALASPRRFLLFEVLYLLCYYTAWEFCFRGVLLLPLVPAVGVIPALAIQTTLTTLLHIGHPKSEIWSTLLGGLALGLVAYFTGSVFYAVLMHASLGIGVDVIQWRRRPVAAQS